MYAKNKKIKISALMIAFNIQYTTAAAKPIVLGVDYFSLTHR